MSALHGLDGETAETVRLVLGRRAPDVLRALEETDDPSNDLRDRTAAVLAEEFSREVSGPDWEPSPHGIRVDDAIGRFYRCYPVDRR
ncbi:hypothetical protein [Actinomycetospora aeridis]|uniref:Uncharacterized protein n=1 Tax=Actinomycetospora aeridis TaxID=3129231 RepID=A0ABU8NEF6_9PSEU